MQINLENNIRGDHNIITYECVYRDKEQKKEVLIAMTWGMTCYSQVDHGFSY
jgi:hypothetical protein